MCPKSFSLTPLIGGGDAIFTIVEALNDGTLHPDLYKAIEPSLLFALRKPNGKPRPIAIGDILDVIAGQCVLATKRIDLNTFLTSDADIRACLPLSDPVRGVGCKSLPVRCRKARGPPELAVHPICKQNAALLLATVSLVIQGWQQMGNSTGLKHV